MATSKGGYVSGGFDILKAPNAPTITSVTTGIGSATVAFTAPADVGGGAITSYTITAMDESTGASTGATGSASPITISPGGGTFKIRAAATNIYGPGRVSQYETGKQIYSGASLWGWGYNRFGQLGQNTVSYKSSPTQVGLLTNWSDVTTGLYPSAAVKTDGTLWGWGFNNFGSVGDNTQISRSSPVQIGALTNWSKVSTENSTVLAVKTDGTLWAWGNAPLGDGTMIARSSPIQIGGLTNWAQVSSSSASTNGAVKTDGTLWMWGGNSRGQLGQNNIIDRSSPVQVGLLNNWAHLSLGGDEAAAVKTDGTLWAWGFNNRGQLGDGTVISRSSPVQIGVLTNWAQVSITYRLGFGGSAAAVKTDGTLWTWGYNDSGQLGQNNVFNPRSSPVQVGALSNWRQVSFCKNFVTAIKTDGTLWAWGQNGLGQLGDNTTNNRSSPIQIGSLSSWYQVSSGGNQTLALYGVV